MMTQTELARWLKDRFTGERARAEFRALVRSGWERALETKAGELIPPDLLETLVHENLTKDRLRGLVRSALRVHLATRVEMAREDHQKLGRWVSSDAKAAIHALVSRKGFVDPEWVRSVFKEDAIEAIISDVIYTAIRDFSAIIPRVVQTQVLSRLGRLGGIGGGIGGRLLEEVERILEPEIRRYLDKGARKGLDGAGRFAVEHLDDAVSLRFRRNLVDFALDQEVAFHARVLSDEVLAEVERIAELVADQVAQSEESKLQAREVIQRLHKKHGDRLLREVLVDVGAKSDPPLEAWADTLWPLIRTIFESQFAESVFADIASELSALLAP